MAVSLRPITRHALKNQKKKGRYVRFNAAFLHPRQVFDATNTTRERRGLILDFGAENDFKASVAAATRGERGSPLASTPLSNHPRFVSSDLFHRVGVRRPRRHRLQHHGEGAGPGEGAGSEGPTLTRPSFSTGSEGVVSGLPRLQQDRRHVGFPKEDRVLQNQLPAPGPRPARQVGPGLAAPAPAPPPSPPHPPPHPLLPGTCPSSR